ncbi:Protein fam72a [Linnemannia hyalina]|uniref:Protein fam72a n=1 Tax=Linnemannia hyalina TaxID=64524 RepID=A0A9P7Y5E0_9FUNG|nr:Protein fam72a [Linnemannia hyalina]
MPQYPPPQDQHYSNANNANNTASSTATSYTPRGYTGGAGYSSSYYGGGNSDRYNTSYSSHSTGSGNGSSAPSGTNSKTVCRMDCRYCSAVVCLRGMKAMLLADTSVELYSTDHPPGSVQLIDKDYTTSNCKCKIRDVACRVCGNVIGYHITQPCQQCLKAPNNGHFWMFHTEGVVGQERMNLDLGKLVQELVRFPHSAATQGAPGAAAAEATRRLAGFVQREPVGPSPPAPGAGGVQNVAAATALPPPPRPINLTTATVMAADTVEPRDNAATTRVTSISRLQRQQQRLAQTTYSPPSYPPLPLRVISSSPTPATPTPTPRTQQQPTATPAANEPSQTSSTTSNPYQHRAAPEPTIGPSATTTLMNLTLSQFLRPMKWEQLPPPDLDIDLDPNAMGGEPLFAGDWMELVKRTAETAAANMSLALDQEEETEQYMARMMEEHRQRHLQLEMVERAELESVGGGSEGRSSEEDDEEDVLELLPDHDEVPTTVSDTEVDLEAGIVDGQRQQRMEDEEGMDRLIHRVDGVALAGSPPAPSTIPGEHKDEDEDMDMNGEPTGRGRTLERRQYDSLSVDANGVPASEQQPTTPSSNTTTSPSMESNRHRRGNSLGNTLFGIVTGAPPLHDDHRPTHRRRNSSHSSGSRGSSGSSTDASSDRTAYYSSESCPAMVLTSAMIAKASASAAAADAATAANSLLFGRRSRRDYDMMCR